jgi:hypothetical protein
MSKASYQVGLLLGKGRWYIAGFILLWALWGVYSGAQSKKRDDEAAVASNAKTAEIADAGRARLQKRCTIDVATLNAEAKAALDKKDSFQALNILNACKGLLVDSESASLLLKAQALKSQQVELANQQAYKKAKATELAELADRKKEGVALGMNGLEVEQSSWGKPQHINRTTTAGGKREQWVYGRNYLYFDNNVLTAIQN